MADSVERYAFRFHDMGTDGARDFHIRTDPLPIEDLQEALQLAGQKAKVNRSSKEAVTKTLGKARYVQVIFGQDDALADDAKDERIRHLEKELARVKAGGNGAGPGSFEQHACHNCDDTHGKPEHCIVCPQCAEPCRL